jgi:hypothetical protein
VGTERNSFSTSDHHAHLGALGRSPVEQRNPGSGRVRRAGGGRKSLTETDPTLLSDLEALVEPDSRGDPMSPLRWTCKSLRALASQLGELGHEVSHTVVGELLKARGFSLHANRKAPMTPTGAPSSP